MIELLKHDDVIRIAGGRFKLTALIQKRRLELMHGARPMVDTKGLTELETILQEIMDRKVEGKLWDGDDEADDLEE